jgi:hypothetical protein
MKKILLLLSLFSSLAFGADHLLYAPSGNLILDAKVGSVIKVNKTLRVDNITNLAGTSGAPGMVPIGGMVAVMPNTHANAWQPPATGVIKDGFMRADGAVVPTCADCVIPAGTTMPNMVSRFPKGSTTSGTTAGSATKNLPGHYHSNGSGTNAQTSVDVTGGTASLTGTTTFAAHPHTHSVVVNFSSAYITSNGYKYTEGDTIASNPPGTSNNNLSASVGISSVPASRTGSNSVTGNFGLVTGGCDGNSGASCSINVEPAYMETVWIIRVK